MASGGDKVVMVRDDSSTESAQVLNTKRRKPRQENLCTLFNITSPSKYCLLSLFGLILMVTFSVLCCVYDSTWDEENFFKKSSLLPTEHQLLTLYDKWLAKYHRNYKDNEGEKDRRFEIFKDNLWFILDHNSNGNFTYKLGLNRFADLSNDEYRSMFLADKVVTDNKQLFTGDDRYKYGTGDELPESIDWRDKGAVAPVKDQSQTFGIGSWAYSTVGAVEGINHIVTGELTPLSEQELVDCDEGFNSSGARQMNYAFEFVLKSGGIHTLDDYPYRGVEGQCDPNREKNFKVVTVTGYENVPPNDENSMRKAVAHQPVSVSVEAGGRAFQLYESGVFNGQCGTELDHGVLAVGYGSQDGKHYWIVRNSWGTGWGEDGYIRLERNVASTNTGKCGIAMQPSYPTKKPKPVCDDYHSCPELTTCCCVYEFRNHCYGWGCCPVESATCCDDHSSCCPQEFPVCDKAATAKMCLLSKDSPIGINALERIPAKPNWSAFTASRKITGPLRQQLLGMANGVV